MSVDTPFEGEPMIEFTYVDKQFAEKKFLGCNIQGMKTIKMDTVFSCQRVRCVLCIT